MQGRLASLGEARRPHGERLRHQAETARQHASSRSPKSMTAGPPRPETLAEVTMPNILRPGTQAPDFTLNVTPDQKLSLHELRGKPAILAFYPADWSPVCGDQMTLYNEVLPEFQKHGAELLGISVDEAWCHAAYAKHQHLHFPLLSDFEPKGAVAKQYGAYRDKDGFAERAL